MEFEDGRPHGPSKPAVLAIVYFRSVRREDLTAGVIATIGVETLRFIIDIKGVFCGKESVNEVTPGETSEIIRAFGLLGMHKSGALDRRGGEGAVKEQTVPGLAGANRLIS